MRLTFFVNNCKEVVDDSNLSEGIVDEIEIESGNRFMVYLTESKDRFIKKNKNLTSSEKKDIIKFFKTNRQAEKDVNWQKSDDLTYENFLIIMNNYKSGRKMSGSSRGLKCSSNLRGLKKDEDYIHVKLKNKNFCAYIPLSWETAQKFNTDKVIGSCSGPWCIGSSINSSEWTNHITYQKEVPIYIVSGDDKWVVMIQEYGGYDVWDAGNVSPKNDIPGLDAKKDLMDSKKMRLYDEVRGMIVDGGYAEEREEVYKTIVNYGNNRWNEFKDLDKELMKWFSEAIKFYKDKENNKRGLHREYSGRLDKAEKAMDKAKHDFDTVSFEKQLYTKVELTGFVYKLQQVVDKLSGDIEDDGTDYAQILLGLKYLKEDGAPLYEDDYDGLVFNELDVEEYSDFIEDYGTPPEWEDYMMDIDVDDMLQNNQYFNSAYDHPFANADGFREDVEEFLKNVHIADGYGGGAMRSRAVTNEDVMEMFDDNEMP